MAGLITETTDATFKSEVLEAAQPVLVDFWVPWCGPCRALVPVLDQLARDHAGKAKIVKLNVDQNPGTAQAYRVQSIPMLAFFLHGQHKGNLVGLQPKE